MFESLRKLFGGEQPDFGQLMKEGALILDVRSKGEYAGGHIKGSLNIPVDQLSGQLGKLKDKNQSIITCCASGMRSASARSILKANGYLKVFNGGGWQRLNGKLGPGR